MEQVGHIRWQHLVPLATTKPISVVFESGVLPGGSTLLSIIKIWHDSSVNCRWYCTFSRHEE